MPKGGSLFSRLTPTPLARLDAGKSLDLAVAELKVLL
jgi:hypothetical protein